MKNLRSTRITGAATLLALWTAAAFAGDLTGKWTGHITDPGGITHELTFTLKSEGDKVTGTVTGGPPVGDKQRIVNGKLEGDQLSFDVKSVGPTGETMTISYSGKVNGNKITGAIGSGGMQAPSGGATVPWEVTKK